MPFVGSLEPLNHLNNYLDVNKTACVCNGKSEHKKPTSSFFLKLKSLSCSLSLSWWGLMLNQWPSVKKRLICRFFATTKNIGPAIFVSSRNRFLAPGIGIVTLDLGSELSILMVLENHLLWAWDNLHFVTLTSLFIY